MFSLPLPLLLVITVAASWITSVLRGAYSKSVSSASDKLWFFNLIQNLSCLIGISIIFICSGGIGEFSLYSVILGAALSLANVFGLYANLKAFAIGPFSYTAVIVALSAIIPTVSGLFFGESIGIIQWIGIGFMALCIILSPDRTHSQAERKASAKWIILCLVAAGFSGTTGVLQKIHQSSADHKGEMAAFLISGFTVSVIISSFMYIKEKIRFSKLGIKPQPINIAAMWIIPVFTGITFSFPHSLNLFLAGALPSAIMFPIVNLCPMIISMITAMILFKEKLSRMRWAGLIIGVLATVLVSGVIKI